MKINTFFVLEEIFRGLTRRSLATRTAGSVSSFNHAWDYEIHLWYTSSWAMVNRVFFAQNSESDNESVRSEPHSFVNHYANVNDTLRQSWKRQRPVRNYSSYTDSEPEGSAVVSLNGGQIVMNNMARSRAPLPGFSSFVWQRPARAAAPPAACHIWRPSRAGGRINNAFIFYTVI